jgi:5'-nucleotidase
MRKKHIILLTNDDGIDARGLVTLKKEMAKLGEVWVVAPDKEQSATSHSLTLTRPLRTKKLGPRVFSIDGTPTDAVMIAIYALMKKRPNLIISGINHGSNLGNDVTYSGTVAAAMEGAILRIPSIAVSMSGWEKGNFKTGARFVLMLSKLVLKKGLPKDTFLNVNLPSRRNLKNYRITRLGRVSYRDVVIQQIDPRGQRYYWIGEQFPFTEAQKESDFDVIKKGFVSITPLHLDMTNYVCMKELKKWKV